jgi:hypothetical protein
LPEGGAVAWRRWERPADKGVVLAKGRAGEGTELGDVVNDLELKLSFAECDARQPMPRRAPAVVADLRLYIAESIGSRRTVCNPSPKSVQEICTAARGRGWRR